MNQRLRVIAQQQGGVFSRRQALASGCSHDQIARRLRDGSWAQVRRGQYAEALDLAGLPSWERARLMHVRQVHAVVNAIRPGHVAVSHQSALVLQGMPIWGLDLSRVHITRLDGRSGGVVAGVQHHLGVLTDADLSVVDGLLVTSVARASLESACTASFEVGVIGVDAALRTGGLGEDEVRRLRSVIAYWPGSAAARKALSFGNGLSESVGESRMRVLMYEHGLPRPRLQTEYRDRFGLIGRVDFDFEGYDTAVEFDGALKYGGGSPDVLVREKRREDRLRALGLIVIRTDWTDFDHPAQLATNMLRVLNRRR
ncbi:type IV toxin-antitoxin system AbiEi family antitoxin domain-containing protein [Kribbella solani]|uniref:type IV toxin-antitoxin system AbiEi family antitoxin domain-containing protein n=1 Tax=Kribbella solani TaxID=236067 RepID=UPI0029B7E208|nr:type IV toxin-antitoxin system AbiEi family antitoxin domain-containing protein [Kribbella solani]MDX2974698.1 type IV toxin-antitoxin system AbiEi family antitoxin domain-containing protein [Kribbella solani]MDX3002724.1 type IV toxin-antitoxin system AbiEi family antitoxin domain-containing protein [Kribbella solani]